MATYSSTLAWKISWTEEPGGLQSMGWQRVRHNEHAYVRVHTHTHTHTHTQVRSWASQVALEVKNQSASAGEVREAGSVPQSGRSPGGHRGNPLQYSCLENPMDGEAWQAMVHRVAKSWT